MLSFNNNDYESNSLKQPVLFRSILFYGFARLLKHHRWLQQSFSIWTDFKLCTGKLIVNCFKPSVQE